MCINSVNLELPKTDNLPHGSSEKQCYVDKLFCERATADVSNINVYAESWGVTSLGIGEKLKVRYASIMNGAESRLNYWTEIEKLLEAEAFGKLTLDEFGKQIEAELGKEKNELELLQKHTELTKKRIEIKERILSKIKAK